METRNHILLTDIDNTLYDWSKFFAPSFRGMLHALAKRLDTSFEQLSQEFKEVYAKHDSLEYVFSIQELKSVRGLSQSERYDIVRVGRGAFRVVQKFHLKPYDGVVRGLEWLHLQGHQVICVTNSPLYLAQMRLYELKLDRFIDGLVAWEGIDPPKNNFNPKYVTGKKRKHTRIKKFSTYTKEHSKPNIVPYELAIKLAQQPNGCFWSIGDSLLKDLEPAAKLGIRTIWAEYGSRFDPTTKNNQTLLGITNWSSEEVELTHDKRNFRPDHRIESFDEIEDILPKNNYSLFDLMGV